MFRGIKAVEDKKLGIIGVGNMGSAIICGALNSGIFTKNEICAFEQNEERKLHIKETLGVEFVSSLGEISCCDSIIIAVKPKDTEKLLRELSGYIQPDTLIVSIVAGITIETLQKHLSNKGHVIRVMPNTPVFICSGVSALCLGENCNNEDLEAVQKIFRSLGTTILIKEDMFDVISALSGSGPAYFFYVIEALVASAVQRGFDENTALNLVLKTCEGASKLLETTRKPLKDLRQEVTSPGGSTAKAIDLFAKKGLPDIIDKAIEAAIQRNKEMGLESIS